MTTHDDERDPLAKLSPEVTPPDAVRVATARRLEEAGLLRRRTPSPALRMLAVAATVVFAFLVGRLSASPPPAMTAQDGTSWALLLYGEPDGGPATEPERVALYRDWAVDTRAAGRLALAEKLGEDGALLGDGGTLPRSPAEEPSGVFVVRAPDLDGALDLARGMPHYRLGGRILVRKIEPT